MARMPPWVGRDPPLGAVAGERIIVGVDLYEITSLLFWLVHRVHPSVDHSLSCIADFPDNYRLFEHFKGDKLRDYYLYGHSGGRTKRGFLGENNEVVAVQVDRMGGLWNSILNLENRSVQPHLTPISNLK
jgi:hypothetical protein